MKSAGERRRMRGEGRGVMAPVRCIYKCTIVSACLCHYSLSQDALRTLIQNSLEAFCLMVQDGCVECRQVPRDYTWQGDLTHSPFR